MKTKTNLTGLTDNEVIESRKLHGENVLTPPAKESLWKLFFEKFQDPMIRILLIAALLSLGISFVHNEFSETIGIFCAIFLSTGVAFWFEKDAKNRFDVLNKVSDDVYVKVLRNGDAVEVLRKELVVGDVVFIETGEEVPADGELIESNALHIDESCLTGEPMIEKSADEKDFDPEATYPTNWVMRGTKVMDGNAVFVVKKVGDATDYGQVSQKAAEPSGEITPLNRQLEKLAKIIGVAGFLLALFTFSALFIKDIAFSKIVFTPIQLGMLLISFVSLAVLSAKVWIPVLEDGLELAGTESRLLKSVSKLKWWKPVLLALAVFGVSVAVFGYVRSVEPFAASSWISIDAAAAILQHFMVAVTIIVVSIPEGLPMSVTLSLALSMRRMLKTNNLVRRMHACETMGAVTVICTDKTGTLTQNRMSVGSAEFPAIGKSESVADLIFRGIAVNTTAFLDFSQPEKLKPMGNPTEGALLLWLHGQATDYRPIREQAQVVEQLPFSTERKYMATLVRGADGKNILFVKGAPEVILSKCREVDFGEGTQPLEPFVPEITRQLQQYQNQAMRTLGFAYTYTNESLTIEDIVAGGLTYLGFVAISDPVREDVPAAVQECLNASIKVKIVTGDTTATAKEIGRQIGIWTAEDGDRNIITGPEFAVLSDEEAYERVALLKIMCRARPSDKQRLVQLLQKRGEVVAVTGDGTNDAPALNYANIGLSMGTGTSVAKEASDITLLDDSFASIVTAVMWGRSLYLNIQRFVLFQLTINVTAMVIVLLGSIFGSELPLTVTQMLWVNLIMDTFAAGALASLPPSRKVMSRPPRKRTDFIITPKMSRNIFATSAVFVAVLLTMISLFTAADGTISLYWLTIFFTFFVLLQVWNIFNAKAYGTNRSAFHNLSACKSFVTVVFLILIGQVLIVQFGGKVFRTEPLPVIDWIVVIAAASMVLWIGELTRLISNRKQSITDNH